MLNDVASELEKLQKLLNRSNSLFAFSTELRGAHFDSNSKLTELIYTATTTPKNANATYLLRSKPISLKLKSPLFISKIEITSFTKRPIRISYTDTIGTVHSQVGDNFKTTNIEGAFQLVYSICAPISELSISTVDGEVTLRRVQGFIFYETATTQNSSIALSNHIDRLRIIQSKINKIYDELTSERLSIEKLGTEIKEKEKIFEKKSSDLDAIILEKEDQLEEIEKEIKAIEGKLVDQKSQLAESSATLSLTRKETEGLSQARKTNAEALEQLQANVRAENYKLHQLQKDVDIFSEDLKSFTGETRKQQIFYGVICLVLLCILIFITNSLFERASDLITYFDNGKIKSIWDVILSRIPFMLSVIGIVTFVAEGVRRCLNQIMIIHEQRLAFLRLSIVAREVIDASTLDCELSKEDVVKLRTKLKLAMLRQHMEKDLGKDVVTLEYISDDQKNADDEELHKRAA